MDDGAEIREARRKLGLSLAAVSNLAGVNLRLIWGWETGHYNPPLAFRQQVRRTLDCLKLMLADLPYAPNTSDGNLMKDLFARWKRGEFTDWRRAKAEAEMGMVHGQDDSV